MIGALFTVFAVEKYQHWTDKHLLCQSFGTSFGAEIPPNKKELSNKHLNSAEFINSFCFGFLSKIAEVSASGTSQAII